MFRNGFLRFLIPDFGGRDGMVVVVVYILLVQAVVVGNPQFLLLQEAAKE